MKNMDNTVLGDKLAEALNKQKEDLTSYVWRGPKVMNENHELVQNEIKLVDASQEQLTKFYEHCKTMLYNRDKVKPGRYILKSLINDQINKCNTVLFLRWLENKYKPSANRTTRTSYVLFNDLRTLLDNNKKVLPKKIWNTTSITAIMSDIPDEFENITIENLLDGCLDTLGIFDTRHITLSFITKLGLWFTPTEMKDLTEIDPKTGKNKDRIEVIRERLNINPNIQIRLNSKGLTYTEFRAMLNLLRKKYVDQSTKQLVVMCKKYNDLTNDQLITLRNKVLFMFSIEVDKHIKQWIDRIYQIDKVAQSKGWDIVDPEDLRDYVDA